MRKKLFGTVNSNYILGNIVSDVFFADPTELGKLNIYKTSITKQPGI